MQTERDFQTQWDKERTMDEGINIVFQHAFMCLFHVYLVS